MQELLQQEGWAVLGALSILAGLLLGLKLLEILINRSFRNH